MRRLAVIGCGLALAIATAVLALPTFAFAAALTRGNLAGLPQSILDVVVWWAVADGAGRVLHEAVAAAVKAVAVICCGPVVLAALIGEVAGWRNLVWCAGASALLSVALPVAAGSGSLAAFAQPIALGPLAATGGVAGLVYWLIAGSRSGPLPRQAATSGLNLAAKPRSANQKENS